MAATKTRPRAAPASRSRPERPHKTRVERRTALSEEVLAQVEEGQRAAIKAVRTFVDTVDRTLPPGGEGPSRRQVVIDAAMDMADRLVQTQYEFLRKVVHSAGQSLSRPDGGA